MYQLIQNRCAVLSALIIAACVSSALAQDDAADESEAVESFLSRLGLVDLQIVHLEQNLDKAASQPRRVKLAKDLADLYAGRLMTSTDDEAVSAEMRRKILAIHEKVPESKTRGSIVMLLQADYVLAESHFNKWIDDPSDTTSLAKAKEILARIAPELVRAQGELTREMEQIQGEIDKIENEDALATKDSELRRIAGFVNRASFFAGWSNYYLGLSKQNKDAAQPEFIAARDGFRKILGITDDEPYEEIDVEWLGLQNIHRANALVGLGLTETALGKLDNSRKCFDFLEHVSAPPTLRDHAAFWFLRGMLNVGLIADAVTYATEQVKKFAGGATQGKVAFCAALVRTGFAATLPASATDSKQLGRLGVQGLARLGQIGTVRQLMTKYKLAIPDEGGGFYLTWLKGQQQFSDAEASKKDEDYELASKTLLAALEEPEAQIDVLSSGQCRYELGWCYFRLKQFEKAALNFRDASAALKEGNRGKAVDAGWLNFHAYFELSKDEPRFVAAAIDALKTFKSEFPESEQAKKADYYLGKLESSVHSLGDSIAALSKVEPSSDNYLSARAELCLLHYQQWSKVREDEKKAASEATNVYDAVDTFLKAARRDADNGRKLKCTMLAVDVAMRSTEQDLNKAQALLDSAAPLADSLPASNSSVAEYHYQRFRLAKAAGDESAVTSHATWITTNAQGSAYERSAIITVAKSKDDEVAAATGSSDRQRLRNEAKEIYLRLAKLMGESQQAIESDKNARIVNSRLAEYEFDTGDYESAASRLEKIVAALPTNETYLRRAGLAQYEAGNYAAALPHWRKLADGLTKNTPDWYEAKYYQLSCLAKTDRESAKRAFDQFKLLYPLDKIDNWGPRFQALGREL